MIAYLGRERGYVTMFNFTISVLSALAKLIGFTAEDRQVQKYAKAIEIGICFVTVGYIAAKLF